MERVASLHDPVKRYYCCAGPPADLDWLNGQCQPLTPTLSPPAGRGRDPREAWEGEGRATHEPT